MIFSSQPATFIYLGAKRSTCRTTQFKMIEHGYRPDMTAIVSFFYLFLKHATVKEPKDIDVTQLPNFGRQVTSQKVGVISKVSS